MINLNKITTRMLYGLPQSTRKCVKHLHYIRRVDTIATTYVVMGASIFGTIKKFSRRLGITFGSVSLYVGIEGCKIGVMFAPCTRLCRCRSGSEKVRSAPRGRLHFSERMGYFQEG